MKSKRVVLACVLILACAVGVLSKTSSKARAKNLEPKIIYKTAAQITEQKEANKPAETRYAKNPDGNDNFELIKDGELLIEVNPGKGKSDPQVYHVRLNKNAIYYAEKGKSFRGVLGSIQLQDLISDQDSPENGKCCSRVKKIESKVIQIKGTSKDYECFEINGVSQIWNLCSKDSDVLFEWRKSIKVQLMVGSLLKRGLTNIRVFVPEEEKSVDCTTPAGWSWKNQQDWPCSCKDGEVQAPLKLLSGESKKVLKVRLNWNYHDVINPQAVFNGHEVEVLGSFGTFSLTYPNSKRTYFANKITFKFPSEHHIDSNFYEGEMLIHHENPAKEKAILSILLQEDPNNEADDNVFLDKLTPEYWTTMNREPVVIEGTVNIETQIVKGGAVYHYKKSFFSYMGSDSTPPCTQNVLRVVMKEPLVIPSLQLQELKTRAFNNDDEPEGNSRKARENKDGIEVTYHVDNSPTCPAKIAPEIENSANEKILEEAAKKGEALLNPDDEAKEGKDPSDPEYHIPNKFIKATSTIESYAITGADPITGDLGNGIVVEEVDKNQVPESIRKKLLNDAQTLAKKLIAKNAITQKKLGAKTGAAAAEAL